MAMIYYHFDNQIIFLIGQFVVVYMMAKILPRRILGRCVTMFTLACLLGSSIWRMITDFGGWHMDITIIFTVTTYTLSVFAFDYQDGGMPPSQVPDLKKCIYIYIYTYNVNRAREPQIKRSSIIL